MTQEHHAFTDSDGSSAPRWRRRLKLALALGGGLLALLVLVVIMLPTFINWGFMRGTVLRVVSDQISGSVTLEGVHVSWGGPLRVERFVIDDEEHHSLLEARLEVEQGLWTLWRKGFTTLHASVQGSVRTRLEPDGALAITRTFDASTSDEDGSTSGGAKKPGATTSSGATGAVLPAGMNLNLTIGPIDLRVDAADGAPFVHMADVRGSLQLAAGSVSQLTLAGNAEYGDGAAGSFRVQAQGTGIISADGALALAGKPIKMQLQGTDLQFNAGGLAVELESAKVAVESPDLTRTVVMEASVTGVAREEAQAQGAQSTATTLQIALAVAHPLAADGSVRADLGGVRGTVAAANVPTRLLQPLVENTALVLTRDVGPTVDLEGAFADASGNGIRITLRGQHLQVDAEGSVDVSGAGGAGSGAATLQRVTAQAQVDPALAAAVAGVGIENPATVSLDVGDLRIPARDASGAFPLGEVTFRGTLTAAVENATLLAEGVQRPLGVNAIQLSASAAPFAKGVAFNLDATPESTATEGRMRASGTLIPGGAFGVHGTIRAQDIPTGLIEPWLPAGLPIQLTQDAGASIHTFNVQLGEQPAAEFTLALDTDLLDVSARGTRQADGGLTVAQATLTAPRVRQALLADWGVQVDAPVQVDVQAHDLRLPSSLSPGELAGTLEVTVTGAASASGKPTPVVLVLNDAEGAAPEKLSLTRANLAVATAGLARQTTIRLNTDVDGAVLTVDCVAERLLDAGGTFTAETAGLDITARVSGVTAARVTELLPVAADLLADGNPLALEGTFRGSLQRGQLAVSATTGSDRVALQGALQPEALTLDADLRWTLTPAQWKELAGGGLELHEPALVSAKVTGFTLARRGLWEFTPSEHAQLNATVCRASAGAQGTPAAKMSAAVNWSAAGAWNVEATLAEVNGEVLGDLVGLDPTTRQRIGSGGSLQGRAQRNATGAITFEARSAIELCHLDLKGALADGVLTLQPSQARLTLPGAQVVALLNGEAPADKRVWKDAQPLELEAAIRSFRMRLQAPETGGGLPEGFAVEVDASIKPMSLTPVSGAPVHLRRAEVTVQAPGIGQPATVKSSVDLATTVRRAGSAGKDVDTQAAATLALDATLHDWTDTHGVFSPATMRTEGTVRVERASTAIVGLLLGMGMELDEALGPDVTLKMDMALVGTDKGSVTAALESQYLRATLPRVLLGGGFLTLGGRDPVKLEFLPSAPLRKRLLEPINPVFTDASLAEPSQRIVLEASAMRYPLDGNYARLDADVQLRVGPVHLRRNEQNQVLNLLKIFQAAGDKPVDGLIEPLTVTVRAGQLTYEKFNVNIEKQGNVWVTRLIFSGDIDLASNPPMARAISANYPMGSVARQVLAAVPAEDGGADLQKLFDTVSLGALDAVQLRVTLSGPLGSVDGKPAALRRKIRVDFKPENLGKGLERAVESVGDAFKSIFDKAKDDKSKNNKSNDNKKKK